MPESEPDKQQQLASEPDDAASGSSDDAEATVSDAPQSAGTQTAGATVRLGGSYLFLAALAASVLLLDAVTKWWAEVTLSKLTLEQPSIVLIDDVLTFTLAYNRGGAFGMLADENDVWRQPFFLVVSVGAVLFIISLYSRLLPWQRALRWGLPLVLGGALGNLADRVAKGKVVDFIDYRAEWVGLMNELIAKVNDNWYVTTHWPTFNVADIAICTGLGLMAVDMFFARKHQPAHSKPTSDDGDSRPSRDAPATS